MSNDDNYYQIDDDVRDLADRIAAATVRMDYGFISEILMNQKARWIEDGKNAQIEADQRKADYEMAWHHKRRYWFRTLDGLLGQHEIDANTDRQEMIQLAPRHPFEFISEFNAADALKPIPIRRYVWRGERHRDGRPIFEEQE